MSGTFWQTDKVRLRAIEPSDADLFYQWNLDSNMARSLYWVPFPQSLESTRRWAQETSIRQPEEDRFFWVIENQRGEFVGSIGTHDTDRRNGNFKYGVAIRGQYQRMGYASDAIRIVLRYYFEELRYIKAVADVYSFNEPSICLHEKLGFTLEGRHRKMIFTNGQHHDVLVFGMLAEEFAYPEE